LPTAKLISQTLDLCQVHTHTHTHTHIHTDASGIPVTQGTRLAALKAQQQSAVRSVQNAEVIYRWSRGSIKILPFICNEQRLWRKCLCNLQFHSLYTNSHRTG